MRKCIKEEFSRALRNWMFWGALMFGLLFSAVNIVENLQRARDLTIRTMDCINSGLEINLDCSGFSVFISWITLHPTGLGSNLFYFLLPVLAALPFGWSYSQDRKTGYFAQAITRMGKRNYFVAKYLAIFTSGGLAVTVPIIVDLLVCAMFLPDRVIRVNDMFLPILNYSFAGTLFYANRWCYALLWCVLTFLWGGAFSCMCFLPGTRLRLSVLIILTPFAITLALDTLLSAVGEFLESKLLSIHYLMRPGATAYNPQWAVLTVLTFFIILPAIVGFWRVTQHELE